MSEYCFTCSKDDTEILAPSKEELAKKIQEHIKDIHHKDVPESFCKDMAEMCQEVAS